MGGDLGQTLNPNDKKGLNLKQWHLRFKQQASWTSNLRAYLLNKASLDENSLVLEVGVGTGAVIDALATQRSIQPFGMDIDRPSLAFARRINPALHLAQADGQLLPLPSDKFDLTYCHYLLLWVADPSQILNEMKRVTRPGGFVIALAEPDHESRIDYPPPLEQLGKLQTEALCEQGVDTTLGRSLRALFSSQGFAKVEAGVLGAQWRLESSQPDKTEWLMIQYDLKGRLSEAQFAEFQKADRSACERGERVLFIPTFYAIGQVPRK